MFAFPSGDGVPVVQSDRGPRPTGNPQSDPSTTAVQPAPDSPNRYRIGRENRRPSASPTPLRTISSEMTMKGNRDGMTVQAHSDSPRPMYSMATSGFRRMSTKQKVDIRQKKTCPKEGYLRGTSGTAVRSRAPACRLCSVMVTPSSA